jgi:hypothetical protein
MAVKLDSVSAVSPMVEAEQLARDGARALLVTPVVEAAPVVVVVDAAVEVAAVVVLVEPPVVEPAVAEGAAVEAAVVVVERDVVVVVERAVVVVLEAAVVVVVAAAVVVVVPLPDGTDQIWSEDPVQSSSSSSEPLAGFVRQSPELELWISPLGSTAQFWAAVALQGYQSMAVPGLVPAAATSKQPPSSPMLEFASKETAWPEPLSQPVTSIGLPSVFRLLALPRQMPPWVISPLAVGVPGAALQPASW